MSAQIDIKFNKTQKFYATSNQCVHLCIALQNILSGWVPGDLVKAQKLRDKLEANPNNKFLIYIIQDFLKCSWI